MGIVIIPDIKNLLPSDPFAPKALARLLADISDYLSTQMPAFAAVTVRNARYVPVRVRLRVRFREEGNQGYHPEAQRRASPLPFALGLRRRLRRHRHRRPDLRQQHHRLLSTGGPMSTTSPAWPCL